MTNNHTRIKLSIKSISVLLAFSLAVPFIASPSLEHGPAQTSATPITPQAPTAATREVEPGVQGFHLVSAEEGWLLVDQRLYWTRSGGQSWVDITPASFGRSVIRAVSFLNTQSGWLVLTESDEAGPSTYAIARTSDGGTTWQISPVPLFEPGDVSAFASRVYLHFLDSETGWLVVRRATSSNFSVGALFRTTDGGDTWTRLTLPIGEPVYFVTSEIGWTAGGVTGQELYRTQDGGLTWQPQMTDNLSAKLDQRRQFQLPRFEDERDGVLPVVVSDGQGAWVEFYRTQTSGQTWNLLIRVPVDHEIAPGVQMPLALFDAERWMIIVPDRNEVLSATSGSHVPTLVGQEHIIGGIRELDMWSPDVGWARHVSGSCSPALQASANAEASVAGRDCFVETRLLRTEDGGRNWTDLSLPQAALISTGDAAELNEAPGQPDNSIQSIGDRTQVFVGQGFDSCTLPSAGQMQNWITNSPYRVWNLYIGGSSRANCGTLTAAFISQLAQQGWKFIPTWVGPQAACSTIFGGTKMDYDPAIAFTQGVSEANAAVDTALTLGLTLADASGTIIYYDLESYDTNNAACRTAASSFISGWSGQVRARANQAGVYGAPCSSALSDFANISNVPDAIWAAYWTYASYNSNASVWNLPCLDNTLWSGSQRLRQYAGGHNETWGGVTLNIDSDVLGGIVSSTCPTITNWKAEYWNNTSLSGPVQLCRDDASLDFDWSLGPPAATIAANNFSARWTRTVSFPAGQYRFYLRHDDGARLFVDDVLRIDAWSTCCMWDQIDLTLTGGDHTLRVEMFEAGGAAYATLRWERLDITGWRGEYYNNTTLSNYPIVVRDDGANINFDWLGQSPDPVIQSDQFSARWTRSVTFTAGVYRFDVFHDDGARLYVDNSLVLQNWCSNCSLTDSAAVVLSAGSHAVRLEMWENSGFAGAQLSWQAVNLTLRFYFPLIVRTP